MDLYEVSSCGIKVIDAKKETKCGWRKQDGGFINRSELRRFSRYTGNRCFYTTNKRESCDWAKILREQMINDLLNLELSIEHNS